MVTVKKLMEYGASNEDVMQIFGVILFTDEHPNVKKVLRDEDYWRAFNSLTGENFVMFSVKPEAPVMVYPEGDSNVLHMMVKIAKETEDTKALFKTFEIDGRKDLPAIYLFTEIEGQYFKVQLKISDESVALANESIKDEIEFIDKAIKRIRKENYDNPEGLYAAFENHCANRAQLNKLNSLLGIYKFFKNLS